MWSQIFLKIDFVRDGVLLGEVTFTGFENQINVLDVDWGMGATDTKSTTSKTGYLRRVKLNPLTFTKRFDIASTALFSCMNSRDRFKTARFTVAHPVKQGNTLREAFVVELSNGYVEDIDLDLTADGKAMVVQESITLRYSSINIQHFRRYDDGGFSNFPTIFEVEVGDQLDLTVVNS